MNPYYLTQDLSYFPTNGYSSGSASPGVVNPGAVHAYPPQQPASSASASAPAPPPAGGSVLSGPLVHPHQDLNDFLESFWTRQMEGVERETPDFKTYNLPLARIKKVMKSDEEVKMISAEAPIMFSKACEIFISELTCRAWLVAEGHKRRTLQKSDVAAAIAFSDVFDFLIDIVPRDEGGDGSASGAAAPAAASAPPAPAASAPAPAPVQAQAAAAGSAPGSSAGSVSSVGGVPAALAMSSALGINPQAVNPQAAQHHDVEDDSEYEEREDLYSEYVAEGEGF